MKWLIKIIAVATYKGGIQKHSIIASLIHIFNPAVTGFFLLILGFLKVKINPEPFIGFLICFYTICALILHKKFPLVIKSVRGNLLKDISKAKREFYAIVFLGLVILSILLSIVFALYSYKLMHR